MRRKRSVAVILAASLVVAALGSSDGAARSLGNSKKPGETVPFKDARIKFEINATDGDGGIQIFIDAEDWRSLEVRDPYGRPIFQSQGQGVVGDMGATELFLEGSEPPFTEVPLSELLFRFPAGAYAFLGEGVGRERITGTATLTHNIPDGPRLISPLQGGPLQDPNNTMLMWESVPPPNGSPIVAYQVLVVNPSSGIPAVPKVTLDIHLPPTATSLQVPPGFLLRNTEYEWEVLAIEAGGNQTLSSSLFKTLP